jgi:hypothetical protein
MTQPMPYQITNDTVMVVVNGEAHEVDSSQPNYEALRAAVLEGRWADVPKHLTVAQAITDWTFGSFTVVDSNILFDGEVLPSAFSSRVLKMVGNGEDPQPLMRAWERLEENPSYRSRQQTFDFLMRNPGIPFTEDGFILFYKGVRNDFRDCHSGKFDNSPGQKPYMKRNRVSDDPTKPCHFGFHVGDRSYARSFGARVVICKVDPADIVCVPNDCSQRKVRIHRYEVIGVDNGQLLPDTTIKVDVEAPAPEPERPARANEPLVAPVMTHTDGSPLQEGETAPKADGDTSQGVTLPLTGTMWDEYNLLDSVELMDMPLRGGLDKYARFNCLVVGASKMRGGKEVMVAAIVEARGYADPAEKETPAHIKALLS